LSKIILGVQDGAGPVDSLALLFEQSCPAIQFFRTASSEEALAFLLDSATADVLPELIVVDAHSLGGRGPEILAKLRASESFWCIPVVVLLAEHSSPDAKANSFSAGVTRYVVEPRTPGGLANAVEAICALLGPHAMARKVDA
jgi:CheY-like chemotaxis protein